MHIAYNGSRLMLKNNRSSNPSSVKVSEEYLECSTTAQYEDVSISHHIFKLASHLAWTGFGPDHPFEKWTTGTSKSKMIYFIVLDILHPCLNKLM